MHMEKIALINGANMNRLGLREPDVYGGKTLPELVEEVRIHAKTLGFEIVDFQSNHEGEIIDKIESLADEGVKYGIINPGAFTHTSIAIRDCLAGSNMKFVEVHISNVFKREDFRHNSYMSEVCEAVVSGMGAYGYKAAVSFLAQIK